MSAERTQQLEQRKKEKELVKALAFDVASRYCERNGLSVENLRGQRFEWLVGVALFLQPSKVKPVGLTNDMKTQPFPTLIIKSDNGAIVVEETEYTRKYLTLTDG